jgi:chromosome segregation ATPase
MTTPIERLRIMAVEALEVNAEKVCVEPADLKHLSDAHSKLEKEVEHLTSDGDEQIVALRAEVERLTMMFEHNKDEACRLAEEKNALRAENERLTKRNGELDAEVTELTHRRTELGMHLDRSVAENAKLESACDGYLGHAAGLRDEVGRLNEHIRFADQEFAAECAGLRGEIERLTDTGSRFAQANAALQDANEDLRSEVHELRAENERLREALSTIANCGYVCDVGDDHMRETARAALQSKGE